MVQSYSLGPDNWTTEWIFSPFFSWKCIKVILNRSHTANSFRTRSNSAVRATRRLVFLQSEPRMNEWMKFPPTGGAAAQRGPWPPHSWSFLITHNDASHSPGLLWTSDQLVAETSTWQHTTLTTDKHPCPPVGFEPTISVGERPQTYAVDRAPTRTSN